MFYREVGQFKTSYAADMAVFPIRQDRIGLALILAFAFLVIPAFGGAFFIETMMIPFLVLSLGAIGLNILTGYTGLLSLGSAKKLIGADDVFPDYQTAVVFYGPKFIQDQPDNAKKFMVALVKAMRFYNDALKDGHIAGPNADQVIKILTEYSFIKDPEVHRAIVSHWTDPNGDVNMPSLQMAWQFFLDTKQIDGSVKVGDVVDLSYVHEAAKVLGPYVKKGAM